MRPHDAVIDLPALDVRGMGRLVASSLDGLDHLARAGRLQALVETIDGRRAMEIFDRARTAAQAQLAEAVSEGRESFALRLVLPAGDLDLVLPFARRVFDLLADGTAMAAVGGAPIPVESARLFEHIAGIAERALAHGQAGGREDLIAIEWPPIDVRRMGAAIAHGVAAFDALWGRGRLESLLHSTEGRRALGLLESLRSSVISQWADAVADGAGRFSLRLTVPRDGAVMLIALARKLFGLLADAETMGQVAAKPMTADDIRVLEEITDHAEGVIAMKG